VCRALTKTIPNHHKKNLKSFAKLSFGSLTNEMFFNYENFDRIQTRIQN
jgi:hypothetical protein